MDKIYTEELPGDSSETIQTMTDLGLEDDVFNDLDEIVIDKKYKEVKEKNEKSGCCSQLFLCKLFG